MSGATRQMKFATSILILFSLYQQLNCLADSAVYIIENVETHQCISAGPVSKVKDSKTSIFKQGTALMKPCSNFTSPNTTDYGQQWTIRIQKTDYRASSYQVQIVMLNAKYIDPVLHAQLRGEFISYFPKLISLIERRHHHHHHHNSSKGAKEFIIINPATGECLTDERNSKQISFSKCFDDVKGNANSSFIKPEQQRWSFKLVNEIHTPRKLGKLVKASAYEWNLNYRRVKTPDVKKTKNNNKRI